MARYVLNSAVITAPGTYSYRLIGLDEMKAWLDEGEWQSTVGYEETAEALSILSGCQVRVNRITIRMKPGDEALVFRLRFPAGRRRLQQDLKGKVNVESILKHSEMGILRCVSAEKA